MLPGDRLVCALVESKNTGFTFKDWLLHMTVVPWFRLEKDSKMIADELELKLQGESSFSVTMGKENVGFGHQKGKLATLVRLPSLLIELEKSVRDYFHSQKAWLVDETTKKRRAFRPHITNQKSGSMHEGDMFICDRLCIVEQKGGFKEIVGVVYLGK